MQRKNYTYLTAEERDKISILHAEGKKPAQIAKELDRNRSTISRELKRDTSVYFRNKYIGSQSHKNTKEKQKKSHKCKRIDNLKIQEYVIEKLKLYWSPKIISQRIKQDIGESISHEAIYQFVYRERPDLTEFLTKRHKGRKPRSKMRKSKKTRIPNRISIKERPIEANERKEFGHFEADTIVSKASLAVLLVIVDRLTRKVKIKKLASKSAENASSSIRFALKEYNILKLLSITYDNGTEFCYHEKVNKELNIQSYFCEPYHSWEKGTVENINGLIRRFFPKGTDFEKVTDEQIKYVEDWINNRPMKVLNFKTPNEKFSELESVAIAC